MSLAGLGHRDFWPIYTDAWRLDSLVAILATMRGPKERQDRFEEAERQILSEAARRRLCGPSG